MVLEQNTTAKVDGGDVTGARRRNVYVAWLAAIFPIGQVMAMATVPMSIQFQLGGGTPGYNYHTVLRATEYGPFSLTLADTAGSEDFLGVGTFEGTASDEDSANVAEVVRLLCRPGAQLKESPDGMTLGQVTSMPSANFQATCDDGVRHDGTMFLAPRDISGRARDLLETLTKSFYAHGNKIVKLDIEVVDVRPAPHDFLVTVRFVNTGAQPLSFPSPEGWSGHKPAAYLSVSGLDPFHDREDNDERSGRYRFVPAGKTMVAPENDPDRTIHIAPHEHRDISFLSPPYDKYTHGRFDFGAMVYLQLSVDGQSFGPANFRSSLTSLSIDRDYPSTLQESEEYEADHRNRMATQPVLVGHAIPESGYYRPIADFRRRSGRFVTRFVAGMKAPEVVVQQAEDGTILGPGPFAWVWTAEASSVIEGFGRHPCPKSGRWLARIPNDVANASYFLSRNTIMQLKQGELIPSIGLASAEDEARVHWEWIGP
jgi:hypothetical protein